MNSREQDAALVDQLQKLALAAGREIIAVMRARIAVFEKADASPVTEADRRAEAVILAGLRQSFPGVPCVAEEELSAGLLPLSLGDRFFLIDPLDGTKEFICGRPDFTVNIALVRNGIPEVGVVYAPAHQTIFAGRPGHAWTAKVSPGGEPFAARPIHVRPCPASPVIVASRSHCTPETGAFIDRYPQAEIVSVGSSLKFCKVASGLADLYPRFGRTMEWDTAAGDAVLRAAGGCTFVDGQPLAYGKRNQTDDADFANPWFIAMGGERLPGARFADMTIESSVSAEAGANLAIVSGMEPAAMQRDGLS
jgi:3'(2'), 5'-bisphosphate nucleotidase